MSAEKNIKSLNTTKYFLKNIGVLRFVPFVVFNILTPVLILISFFNSTDYLTNALMITQYICPLFSVWLSVFILREFLEAEGREIFYCTKRMNLLYETAKLFAISLLNILLICVFCCILEKYFLIEFVRIIIVCIFYFSLAYFLSMLCKSTSITIFSIILFTLINVIFKSDITKFPLFMSTTLITYKDIFTLCLPFLIISILFISLGRFFEKQITSFE